MSDKISRRSVRLEVTEFSGQRRVVFGEGDGDAVAVLEFDMHAICQVQFQKDGPFFLLVELDEMQRQIAADPLIKKEALEMQREEMIARAMAICENCGLNMANMDNSDILLAALKHTS